MPEETLSIIIRALEAIALLALGLGAVLVAVRLRRFERTAGRIEEALGEIARSSGPVLDRARAIGENVNYVTMRIRRNVDEASEVVSRANRRIEEALDAAETRVHELNAVIEVVQDEVEETLLTAGSALRGIRTGAEVLANRRERGRPNEEPDTDESARERREAALEERD